MLKKSRRKIKFWLRRLKYQNKLSKILLRLYVPILRIIFFIKFRKKFSKPPIIIGGCARSGTTLLLSVLSAHPEIFSIPIETHVFSSSNKHKKIIALDFNKIYYYLLHYKIPNSSKRWCEKSARNIRFFGNILNYFKKNVKLIHMVRDGRDVILSVVPQSPSKFWVSPERWINDVKSGLKYEDHPQVLTIRYEDLVLNFEETIKNICDFINEECNEHILNWHKYTSVTEHKAWFTKAKPLHQDSIGKWKNSKYTKTIEKFMKNSEAVKLLKYFNYI